MDEKTVGKNPNHKCVCKDTHPGLGPHRDCKQRGYHLCGCGRRAPLMAPDHWMSLQEAAANFLLGMIEMMTESPVEKCVRLLNQTPQMCATVKPHFHAHHHTKKGLMHLCLIDLGDDEEECAKKLAKIMDSVGVMEMDLIHVGGEPAYHSSHVEMDKMFSLGIHLDPVRRN